MPAPTQYRPFEPSYDHAVVCEKLAAALASAQLEIARLQAALEGATVRVRELEAKVREYQDDAAKADMKAPA